MEGSRIDQYLIWRSERLERRYAKVLKVIRWTAASMTFGALFLALGLYLVWFRDLEPSRFQAYGLFALGLLVFLSLVFHQDARGTRDDIDEELDVIYSLFPQDEILELHGRERATVYPHDRPAGH